MTLLRAVIVEDDQTTAGRLQRHCPNVQLAGVAATIAEAAILVFAVRPDILFINLALPVEAVCELLETLGNYDLEVIFVVEPGHASIPSMLSAGVVYLLKPFTASELRDAVERAAGHLGYRNLRVRVDRMLEMLKG